MSYSRTINGTVHYSGTTTCYYTYGASQSGGSGSKEVSYSGEVPVSINLYVDTDPFDNSVMSCSNSVRTLNGAVVSMNSAQVASIRKGAKEVSDHVLNGFFNMISSELSQAMIALLNKFKSVYELMTTKSSTLEKQQVIMQDDYSRISDRYNKIFTNLDEELEKRVIALDKNVFEISKRVQGEQLHSETSKKVAQFLLGVNEDEILNQELLIANSKAKVERAIGGLAENVVQENAYAKKVNSIVSDIQCGAGQKSFIPVIFTESSDLNSDRLDYSCYSNPGSQAAVNRVNESVKNYFVSNLPEKNSDGDYEAKQIDEAFTTIAEREFQDLKDEKSIRVYELLKKLKENE